MLRKELNQYVFTHRASPDIQDKLLRNNDFSNMVLDFMQSRYLCDVLSSGVPPSLPYSGFMKEVLLTEGLCDDMEIASMQEYFDLCTREIPGSIISENPYIQTIRFPYGKTLGGWEFTSEGTLPYEPFICDDIKVMEKEMMEIPQVGWCTHSLSYPCIKQDGREWMAVKPSEIISMAPSIETAGGKVLVLGLGLGYFPFMASLKNDVDSVTIVERDPSAISLFNEFLLPQFPCGDKISVIQDDALSFLPTVAKGQYDWAFVDLWHDSGDGAMLFAKCRSLEKPYLKYLYWMDETLQSALRWKVVFG